MWVCLKYMCIWLGVAVVVVNAGDGDGGNEKHVCQRFAVRYCWCLIDPQSTLMDDFQIKDEKG